MNGKIVVVVMVALVLAVLGLAFWWPEGAEVDEPAAEPEAAEEDEDEPPKKALRIKDRDADGSVVITNVPEGMEDPVVAARARRDARLDEKRKEAEARGENPFEAFVDDGTPMTAGAMDRPSMAAMEPTDPEYDPAVDAQQRFHGYEQDILAAAPLSPESWKTITQSHQDDIKGVFKRSKELVDAGENDKARLLIEEWAELQNKYKAQAYGRSPQAFVPDQ
jgi:hypothetical protein